MSVIEREYANQNADLLEQIQDLARSHRSLLSRLSNAELLADAIAFKLVRLEKYLETGELARPGSSAPGKQKESGQKREELRLLADSGVTTVESRPRSDGLTDVRIDAGKSFTLPPMLADLLSVLCLHSVPSDDRLVGWKTIDEVAILLGKRSGRLFTRHAVTQSIYRLRREIFKRGGANPYLIQTNRRRGVRFALKSESSGRGRRQGQEQAVSTGHA
ncbi:MAG: hypothetical protein QOD75_3528 [Blastocatellia bacterium]|nr:hypothetical protein [Blastocatellia bacterium]